MKKKNIFLLLAVLGFIIPYYFFISFLLDNRFDINLFFNQMFANEISTFFTLDVIIAAVVLLVFIHHDSRNKKIKNLWISYLGTILIGVSFGLPFYLYQRTDK